VKKKAFAALAFAVVALCSLLSPAGAKAAPPAAPSVRLTAAGSGVNLGITTLLAQAFMKKNPGIAIAVPGSIGTRGAIKAAAEGAITLGLISRSLTKEEAAMGLVARPYGRVPVVIAAGPGVKDEEITFQELIEIYQGTRKSWKDGGEIIVQSREKSDSGFLVLQNKIPGFREVFAESQQAGRWTLYYTDQEANQAIVKTPRAIGVSDLGMIKSERLNIKPLKLNGVRPSPETLLNGAYPLERELSFIYLEKSLPKEAGKFLDFVSSEAGRKILKSNGYLPVN
jgi:phosphate transport system substrate-binding protein